MDDIGLRRICLAVAICQNCGCPPRVRNTEGGMNLSCCDLVLCIPNGTPVETAVRLWETGESTDWSAPGWKKQDEPPHG